MRRPLAAVVLAIALLAGACGNGDGDGTASGDLPLLPSSGGVSGGAAESATGAGSAGRSVNATADASTAMIAPAEPYQPVEYRLADEIDPMGGEGAAYRLEAMVDEAAVKRLAAAFDVDGTPREENGSWSVGRDAARHLFVGPDGSFNVYDQTVTKAAEVAVACTSDGAGRGACSPTPVPPPAPADLPTDEEAEEAAVEVFQKAGIAVGDREARVDRSEYNVTVALGSAIDGRQVEGWGFVVGFGDGAAVQYISGSLANPSKIGDYPLVTTKDAYERWTSGMGGGGRVGITTGAAEPAVGAPEPAVDLPASETVPEGTVPGGTVPTLPPRIVEIDSVERVLLVEYPRCPGDPMYLVPGYRLSAGDDVYATIPAVSDEYLQSSADRPGDDPVSSDGEVAHAPCPNAGVGDGVPGREPDSPPATDGAGSSGGYPPVTIE